MYIALHSSDTFDETSVYTHDIGHMAYTCSECGPLMFKDKKSDCKVSSNKAKVKFSLCCSYGGIKLLPIKEPPEKLKCLLTKSTKSKRERLQK